MGRPVPVITQAWRDSWEHVIPFLAYQPEICRVIYTTASRRSTGNSEGSQTKGHFPTEDAAHKLLYLAIQHASPQWTRTRGPTKALLAFKIQFGDRLPD